MNGSTLILGLLVSAMLVTGQSLWKVASSAAGGVGFWQKAVQVLFSPQFIAGAIIYVFATVLYVVLLGREDYFRVQALVVPASLVLALVVSNAKFHERITSINLAGMVLLIVAIILVLKR